MLRVRWRFHNGAGKRTVSSTAPNSLDTSGKPLTKPLLYEPWTYSAVPKRFWNDINNQRRAFDWLSKQLAINSMEEWYNVSPAQIKAHSGIASLIHNHYNDSFVRALTTIYADHTWKPWLFEHFDAPRNYWREPKHQREFLDWLMRQLNMQSLDSWYQVSTRLIRLYKGGGLLDTHNGSLRAALSANYPTHTFEAWRFLRVANNTWTKLEPSSNDLDVLKSIIRAKEEEMGVAEPSDWYRISTAQLRQFGLLHIVRQCGGLQEMLKLVYPDHVWDSDKLSSTKKKAMENAIRSNVAKLMLDKGKGIG